MKKYFYVLAQIPLEFGVEIGEVSHGEFSCTGIEEFSIEEARVDEILGDRSYSGADLPLSVINEVESTVLTAHNKIKFYFENEDACFNFNKYLCARGLSSEVIEAAVKDWNEEWKKSYSPIFIDQTLEVIPEWEKNNYKSESEKQVYIYPGQGFGTGSHETTFLCLKLMTEILKTPNNIKACLDFGCGSGILALSLRLFKSESRLDLYDIDIEALKNCEQNIKLNSINTEGIQLLLPKDRTQIKKKYDLIFANILQNVLLLEKTYLACSLEGNGRIILSGLLKGQEEEVILEYLKLNTKLEFVKTITKGDWVATLLRHK